MSANLQVTGRPAPRVSLPAAMALILIATALTAVVTLIAQRSSEPIAPAPAVVAPHPWAGVDVDALREAGFTGRLGAATHGVDPWAGVDVDALREAGFTGRLGAATQSSVEIEALRQARFEAELGG